MASVAGIRIKNLVGWQLALMRVGVVLDFVLFFYLNMYIFFQEVFESIQSILSILVFVYETCNFGHSHMCDLKRISMLLIEVGNVKFDLKFFG